MSRSSTCLCMTMCGKDKVGRRRLKWLVRGGRSRLCFREEEEEEEEEEENVEGESFVLLFGFKEEEEEEGLYVLVSKQQQGPSFPPF